LNLKLAEVVDPPPRSCASVTSRTVSPAQRRGVTLSEAHTLIDDRNIFASMMVHMGDADALVPELRSHFPDTIRPALQVVRMREGLHKVAGCYP